MIQITKYAWLKFWIQTEIVFILHVDLPQV